MPRRPEPGRLREARYRKLTRSQARSPTVASIEAVHARQILDSRGNPTVVKLVPRLPVDEAEVVPVVEIRGPAHREEVIGALRPAGYTLAFG